MEGKQGKADSFADFLTGSYDANYLVNPNARGHVSKTDKAMRMGAASLGMGLKMGAGLIPIKKKDIESKDKGFGNGDLNHLSEERGRFPGIDVDHFEFEGESDDG
jgi:hypothetical protein